MRKLTKSLGGTLKRVLVMVLAFLMLMSVAPVNALLYEDEPALEYDLTDDEGALGDDTEPGNGDDLGDDEGLEDGYVPEDDETDDRQADSSEDNNDDTPQYEEQNGDENDADEDYLIDDALAEPMELTLEPFFDIDPESSAVVQVVAGHNHTMTILGAD